MEKIFTKRQMKKFEDKLRKKARRMGYTVEKSRKSIGPDNLGAFMLIDSNNCVVGGERYDMTLDDVEKWLSM